MLKRWAGGPKCEFRHIQELVVLVILHRSDGSNANVEFTFRNLSTSLVNFNIGFYLSIRIVGDLYPYADRGSL
jgi:hypothetical protein